MAETTFDQQLADAQGTSNQAANPEAMRHSAREQRSHREGRVARTIEEQTARLPSDTWLWAAGGSIALSLYLQAIDEKQKALFVGQWAPTFLLLGIYNKLVKQHGSD